MIAATPPGTYHGCPKQLLPLPAVYAPAADRAALHFAHAQSPSDAVGAYVTDTRLVRHWLPSGWIRDECGRLAWERSVVVTVFFPKLDLPHNPIGHCNDCARLTYIAARTARGWRVWGSY